MTEGEPNFIQYENNQPHLRKDIDWLSWPCLVQ